MEHRGKREWIPLPADAIASLLLLFGVPLIACMAGLLLPPLGAARSYGSMRLFTVAVAMAVVGIAGLVIAKWPVWRKGRLGTFGASELSRSRRCVYWMSYALIAYSAFLLGMLIVALHAREG